MPRDLAMYISSLYTQCRGTPLGRRFKAFLSKAPVDTASRCEGRSRDQLRVQAMLAKTTPRPKTRLRCAGAFLRTHPTRCAKGANTTQLRMRDGIRRCGSRLSTNFDERPSAADYSAACTVPLSIRSGEILRIDRIVNRISTPYSSSAFSIAAQWLALRYGFHPPPPFTPERIPGAKGSHMVTSISRHLVWPRRQARYSPYIGVSGCP